MPLPIESVLHQLLAALGARNAAVLQAPPGAGKTTRVPLALLEADWLDGRKIVMLEPRRLAARAAARFMSGQLGEAVGRTVGYRMRLDSKVSADTRIEVVTEGVLTRLLQNDPSLAAYGAVIFDEFHERSLQADLGLALTLEAQQALREDLRIVVMSATLDGAPIARLLGDAPLIESRGRAYPVEVRYSPAGRLPLERHLTETVLHALREESGSVLVFLPGGGEIRRLARMLASRLPTDVLLAPLYGELAQDAQDAAIAPAPAGRRKVVLATAIAETSLTIEGVRIVIDAGLQRRPAFDPVAGLTRLVTQRVSQAAAEQRKGRAGRVEPGVCYRLWPEAEQSRLAAFTAPEILDTDLADLVLELAQWGALDPSGLAWLDPPPAPAWAQAKALLQRLEALDSGGRITDHGRDLRRLPLHPRLAHMLLRGRALDWGRLAAELAALLSERDVLIDERQASVDGRIAAIRNESTAPVDQGRLRRVREAARSLQTRASSEREETSDSAGILLALAYPDRVAQRRPGDAPRFLLANGRGALLNEADPLRAAGFIVAAELDGDPREARVFLAAPLSRQAIDRHLGDQTETVDFVAWDDTTGAVLARRQRRYGALVLDDAPLPTAEPTAVADALAEGVRRQGLHVLPWNDALRQWQARVMLLHRLEPTAWPDVSDEALAEQLEQWFSPFAQGISRLPQLRNFALREALESLLSYAQRRMLDAQAPTHYQVPSGSRIAIDYLAGETPALPVKLQEMFGQQDTPRIAGGRVALTVHLLSPARRPVQVTQDLAGFWRTGYAEVRKELRGRYPKHPWPEDPLSAPPTRGTKRSLQ
jgi:ATP-dependent helicase HrpB